MKRIIVLALLLLTTIDVSAQFGRQRQNRIGRQTPVIPPNENQKEANLKRALEVRAEYISAFLSSLDADEFQKEIAKQTITDFYERLNTFSSIPFGSISEKKDAFELFKNEHFKEIKSMFSENDNKKLDEFLDGKFKKEDLDNKKKKKNKRRKRNKDKDN